MDVCANTGKYEELSSKSHGGGDKDGLDPTLAELEREHEEITKVKAETDTLSHVTATVWGGVLSARGRHTSFRDGITAWP